MIGGGRPYLAHRPEQCMLRDDDDTQMEGIAEFFRSWPASDVKDWEAESPELERAVDEGGCWTGGEFEIVNGTSERPMRITDDNTVETDSADMFPFIGRVPRRSGHWIAAGFAGHGEHFRLQIFEDQANALRYATDPSLHSSCCAGSARLTWLRPEAASAHSSVPTTA